MPVGLLKTRPKLIYIIHSALSETKSCNNKLLVRSQDNRNIMRKKEKFLIYLENKIEKKEQISA